MNDRSSADELPRTQQTGPVRGPWPVDLAHTRPFRIGGVEVRPASLEILGGGKREVLEPRVMEVLVVLAAAPGAILTRDDLITACWGGRAVTDDAVSRVISRLRGLSRSFGGFRIETISKVGYRLVDSEQLNSAGREKEAGQAPRFDRRTLVASAVAGAATLGAAAFLWRQPWRHRPLAEAEALYRRGTLLSREGLPGQVQQTVSYFERAVAVDPDYAEAWGALALSYSHLLAGFDNAEAGGLPDRIRSAARRALELDPDNADAQLARIFITPYFGDWASKEAALRRIVKGHPRHWLAHGRLAVLLYGVGRLGEGIELHRRALTIEPMLPIAYYFLINNLSALGRLQEAEAAIDTAQDRWPTHPALWFATFEHWLSSGKPQSAAAFVGNPDFLPAGFGPAENEPRLRLAKAVDGGTATEVEASVRHLEAEARADIASIPWVAKGLSLLGRLDSAHAALEGYYFGRGPFADPGRALANRHLQTDVLFSRAAEPLRADPRFAALVREVGLEDYWRQTGTVPDYRRTSRQT
jgi:DNA-binding winged helix-turn-helix (wHTH) protein/tetratricopeptide (TPR) repeat protein